MGPPMLARPPRVHWLAWLGLGGLIVVLNRYTNLDLQLAGQFYDSAEHTFPARSIRLLDLLFHDGLRWVAGLLVLVLLVQPFLQPPQTRRWQGNVFLVGVAVLSALVVSIIKAKSNHSCPWDLTEFGGAAPYFRLFDPLPLTTSLNPGRCFPSGHASTAFMWIVLLYSTLPWVVRLRPWLVGLLLVGALLAGGVQVAKGAHFLSHVLATAWVCWGVTLVAVWAGVHFGKLPTD